MNPKFAAPAVCTFLWNEDDWIRYIGTDALRDAFEANLKLPEPEVDHFGNVFYVVDTPNYAGTVRTLEMWKTYQFFG